MKRRSLRRWFPVAVSLVASALAAVFTFGFMSGVVVVAAHLHFARVRHAGPGSGRVPSVIAVGVAWSAQRSRTGCGSGFFGTRIITLAVEARFPRRRLANLRSCRSSVPL
jgi:hypothetical protein